MWHMSGLSSSLDSVTDKREQDLRATDARKLAQATIGPIDDATRAAIAAALMAAEGGQQLQPDSSVAQLAAEAYATDFVARHFRKSLYMTPADGDQADIRAAQCHAAELLRQAHARDPMEHMLLAQMIWAYGRAAYYSNLAARQKYPKWAQIYLTAAERATNQYCRAMRTLSDYRRPPRRSSFTAIKRANIEQANIAQQQVNVATAEPGEDQAIPPFTKSTEDAEQK
jgi:hypothetical protein